MEAPEKIYFDESDVRGVLDTYQYKFPHDIFEYVRKDIFIEKAWDWIENNLLSSNQQDKSLLYYEQFKKHLEK